MELRSLFRDQRQFVRDLLTQADIALDLGEYGLAAQTYWMLKVNVRPAAYGDRDILAYFLYALEKLGQTHFKVHFKGDHRVSFKAIEATLRRRMQESDLYKAFCDKGDGSKPDPKCKHKRTIDVHVDVKQDGSATVSKRPAAGPARSAR